MMNAPIDRRSHPLISIAAWMDGLVNREVCIEADRSAPTHTAAAGRSVGHTAQSIQPAQQQH
jgi:hypothetical protein